MPYELAGPPVDRAIGVAVEAADAMEKLRQTGVPVGSEVLADYADVLIAAQDAARIGSDRNNNLWERQ